MMEKKIFLKFRFMKKLIKSFSFYVEVHLFKEYFKNLFSYLELRVFKGECF
jgi:hypothetical protein